MSVHVVRREVCAWPMGPRTSYVVAFTGVGPSFELGSSEPDAPAVTTEERVAIQVLEASLEGGKWALISSDGSEESKEETSFCLAEHELVQLFALCDDARRAKERILQPAKD